MSEWIKCEARMPEFNTPVLAYFGDGFNPVVCSTYDADPHAEQLIRWKLCIDPPRYGLCPPPSHWMYLPEMPLPEPPK